MIPLYDTNLSIVDSRDDSKYVFIVIDGCKTPVLKIKLKDQCYVLRLVDKNCHLELDLSDCHD